MENWTHLSLYESTDVVRDLFLKRHGRELSLQKAREIVSAFAQGREYFLSAANAGMLVRPLLQYYGVLSLSRGLILALEANLRECALPQSHGLSSHDWNATLADLTRPPMDLQAKVTNGTFLSLMESTKNAGTSIIYVGPYPSRLRIYRTMSIEGLRESTLKFRDILARIPELREIYERSFGHSAANYRAFVFAISRETLSTIHLFPGACGLPAESDLRMVLRIPPEAEIQPEVRYLFVPPGPCQAYSISHPGGIETSESLPQIDNLSDSSTAIVTPFPDGRTISRIGRLFLLSFFLGTLARYHPTNWLSTMQSRQAGDAMLPIIRTAMNLIQVQFPELITQELEGNSS